MTVCGLKSILRYFVKYLQIPLVFVGVKKVYMLYCKQFQTEVSL